MFTANLSFLSEKREKNRRDFFRPKISACQFLGERVKKGKNKTRSTMMKKCFKTLAVIFSAAFAGSMLAACTRDLP